MPNKIYMAPETAITFTDDATGGDYTLDGGANGASGNVFISDQADLGSGDRARWFDWSMVVDGFATAPVEGEAVYIYGAQGRSATDIDGDLAATSGTSSTVVLPNLKLLGVATVQTTTAGDELRVSGQVEITSRYFTVVIYNATADALASSSDAHTFTLTPIPDEVQ